MTAHLQIRWPEEGPLGTAAEIAAAVGGPALRSIEVLTISLATTSLPEDLQDNLRVLMRALPRVSRVEVVAPGAEDKYPVDEALALKASVEDDGAVLTLGFVLDAEADPFEALAKRENSLRSVRLASRALRIKGASVRWWVPVRPELVHRLEAIFTLAQDEWIDPVLVAPWGLPSGGPPIDALSEDQLLFAKDFIVYRLLDEDRSKATASRIGYYTGLRDSLDGAGPRRPAGSRQVAALVRDDAGALEVKQTNRSTLDDGQTAGSGSDADAAVPNLIAQAKDLAEVLVSGNRALGRWAVNRASSANEPPVPLEPDARLPRIMVIGAYGGEHIGDAAILGGVLVRCHEQFGTTEAVLMSQRPEHTRRLVRMLDLPVELTVQLYEHAEIRNVMSECSGVVYAGGPLMDLPKQLVRHLYAATLARAQGKPLLLEGIGAGPFTRAPSEWTARRLTTMASRITVRTSVDAQHAILDGLAPQIGHDPAFDYLATRPQVLTRLPDEDAEWVERVLDDTADKLLIGINLRPIRDMFTTGAPAASRAAYTRFVVSRFEDRLAEAMKKFRKVSSIPPCFIYYSMNSIQFGSPDLRSAYRLQRHLRNEVDFRVWQGDPSIDGVVALLRRLHLAIAMRFHANIFAMSQDVKVVGIDYRPGKRDKVDALHTDRGTIANVRRIDDMTVDWLVERLVALADGFELSSD